MAPAPHFSWLDGHLHGSGALTASPFTQLQRLRCPRALGSPCHPHPLAGGPLETTGSSCCSRLRAFPPAEAAPSPALGFVCLFA